MDSHDVLSVVGVWKISDIQWFLSGVRLLHSTGVGVGGLFKLQHLGQVCVTSLHHSP